MILAEFSNLTFDPEADIKRVPDVKFIPLDGYDWRSGRPYYRLGETMERAMNIPLKKRYQDWIAGQVSAGRYASEIEAIEEAIAEKMENEEAEYFRERLRLSKEDIKAGRVIVADDAYFESKRQRIRGLYMKDENSSGTK
jgi:Arc/MetJ-type ribon-helix-helix transcriptional regulator